MKYFELPYTPHSIKKQYKALAMRLHPDKKGNENKFKEMVIERDAIMRAIESTNNFLPMKAPKKKSTQKKVFKKQPAIVMYKHLHLHLTAEEFFDHVISKIIF